MAQNQNGPGQNGPQLLELLLLAAACALYEVHCVRIRVLAI